MIRYDSDNNCYKLEMDIPAQECASSSGKSTVVGTYSGPSGSFNSEGKPIHLTLSMWVPGAPSPAAQAALKAKLERRAAARKKG